MALLWGRTIGEDVKMVDTVVLRLITEDEPTCC